MQEIGAELLDRPYIIRHWQSNAHAIPVCTWDSPVYVSDRLTMIQISLTLMLIIFHFEIQGLWYQCFLWATPNRTW